jgi:hypothetical protein
VNGVSGGRWFESSRPDIASLAATTSCSEAFLWRSRLARRRAAPTQDGKLFQETETFSELVYGHCTLSWNSQDISGGRRWTQISADNDALGRDEVYAVENGTNNLYLYDQGNWTQKDSAVVDVSGAGGGYFYDVDYAHDNYDAYLFNPNWQLPYSAPWTYLGCGLE